MQGKGSVSNSSIIVGIIDSIEAAGDHAVPGANGRPGHLVFFKGGADPAYLDPGHPLAGLHRILLEAFQEIAEPVQVEATAGRTIAQLSLPLVTRVLAVQRDRSGHYHVRLDESAARHTVSTSAPRYTDRVERLQESVKTRTPVLITEDPDTHEILGVNELPPGVELEPVPFGAMPSRAELRAMITALTKKQSDELVRRMRGRACSLPIPDSRSIPFLYPDNGCWVRAQRMCELMAETGIVAGKIWIYGDLQVRTANHQNGIVRWDWHVAPVVRLSGSSQYRVIDPGLSDEKSLSRSEWVRAQGDPNAITDITPAGVFKQPEPGNRRAERPGETARSLTRFVAKLVERSQGRAAPPPYGRALMQ